MHVLVSGGTGFLGSHLVEAFLDRGGYEPKVALAEGLRETVKSFRSKMPAA